jgi:hypothetical protein
VFYKFGKTAADKIIAEREAKKEGLDNPWGENG